MISTFSTKKKSPFHQERVNNSIRGEGEREGEKEREREFVCGLKKERDITHSLSISLTNLWLLFKLLKVISKKII